MTANCACAPLGVGVVDGHGHRAALGRRDGADVADEARAATPHWSLPVGRRARSLRGGRRDGHRDVDTKRIASGAIVQFAAARHMANMFARNGLRVCARWQPETRQQSDGD